VAEAAPTPAEAMEDDGSPVEEQPRYVLPRMIRSLCYAPPTHALIPAQLQLQRSGLGTALRTGRASRAVGEGRGARGGHPAPQATSGATAQAQPTQGALRQEAEEVAHAQGT
jgi:hypothetical protein